MPAGRAAPPPKSPASPPCAATRTAAGGRCAPARPCTRDRRCAGVSARSGGSKSHGTGTAQGASASSSRRRATANRGGAGVITRGGEPLLAIRLIRPPAAGHPKPRRCAAARPADDEVAGHLLTLGRDCSRAPSRARAGGRFRSSAPADGARRSSPRRCDRRRRKCGRTSSVSLTSAPFAGRDRPSAAASWTRRPRSAARVR